MTDIGIGSSAWFGLFISLTAERYQLIGELLTRIYHEAGGAAQFHAEEYVPDEESKVAPAPAPTAQIATEIIA